jgi:hypothetical protein
MQTLDEGDDASTKPARSCSPLTQQTRLTPRRLDTAESFFTRHGGKVVTIARFVEGLRQTNGIIAGITGMAWRRFLAFNALGAALWVGLGDLAGNHITAIYDTAHRYELYLLIAVAVLLAAVIARQLLHYRSHPTRPPAHRTEVPPCQLRPAPDSIRPPRPAANPSWRGSAPRQSSCWSRSSRWCHCWR